MKTIERENISRAGSMGGRAARSTKVVGFLAALAAVALLPRPAVAGLMVNVAGAPQSDFVQIALSQSFEGQTSINAGIQTAQISNNNVNVGGPFQAYCVDLYHNNAIIGAPVAPGITYAFNLQSLSFLNAGQTIANLLAQFGNGNNGPGLGSLLDQQAGLQLAIWETEYPGVLHVAANQTGDAGQAILDAAYFIAHVPSGSTATLTILGAVHGDDGDGDGADLYQDLIGPGPVGVGIQSLSSPEPSTFLLGAVGGIGWFGVALRRRRRAALAA